MAHKSGFLPHTSPGQKNDWKIGDIFYFSGYSYIVVVVGGGCEYNYALTSLTNYPGNYLTAAKTMQELQNAGDTLNVVYRGNFEEIKSDFINLLDRAFGPPPEHVSGMMEKKAGENSTLGQNQIGHLLSWINLLEISYQNCTTAITDFLCADDAPTRRKLINQLTDAPPVWADRPHDLIADLYAAVQRREEDGR